LDSEALGYSTGLSGKFSVFHAGVNEAVRVTHAALFDEFVPPGGFGTLLR
jgi:hypothetical protein